jgi:hypothetical protein
VINAHILACDFLQKLCFSYRPQFQWSSLSVHGSAFHCDAGDDPMPAGGVAQKIVKQVRIVGTLPQVVVRVADG